MRWILNGPALEYFCADATARAFFAGTRPFVIQRRDDPLALPAEWEAIAVRSFTSYASLELALRTRPLDPSARAVLYDCEVWKFTPEEEQRAHATFTERAAGAVRARGLAFITAPAVNLTRLLPRPTEHRYEDFLAAGFAADAARHADVYNVQAQGSLPDTSRYARFVKGAARQARDANARVAVFAGISTNPGGQRVDASAILRAIAATRDDVDGYWFNVPKPSEFAPRVNVFLPGLALEVIGALAREIPGR